MADRENNWFLNLFFWWIGDFVFGIIGWIGQILALFTEWQWGYDTMVSLIPEFKPPDMGTTYEGKLKLGV